MHPGPLGILATNPIADAPWFIAICASLTELMQHILILGFIILDITSDGFLLYITTALNVKTTKLFKMLGVYNYENGRMEATRYKCATHRF